MTHASTALTWLFVPGDAPGRFDKAATSGADAALLDLEDAVAPSAKADARDAVADYLAGATAYVRVNAPDTPWYEDDLRALGSAAGLRGVMLPKAESADQVASVTRTLGSSRALIALVETARGVLAAEAIASTTGVTRLAFGSVDLALDTGVRDEDTGFLYARSHLVLCSRAAGLAAPIDGVTTNIDEGEPAGDAARLAAQIGFGAKLCVHPRQIAPVAEAFAPTPEDIAWASQVVAAAADSEGKAVRLEGEMIDRPRLARAEAILNRPGS